MAAKQLPYVNQPGSIVKVFEKVKEASVPDRFTGDFLDTKLGFRGGNYQQFMPLAKRMGFLNQDGTPTDLYKQFRNPATSGASMAQALRKGFAEVFERNEYAGSLDKDKFKGLVVEITGREANDRVVQLISATWEALRKLADFDAKLDKETKRKAPKATGDGEDDKGEPRDFDLALSYTINLVLPKTDDPAVFNAIFKSLRDNLLRR